MASMFNFSNDLPYSKKVQQLMDNGVAVWDVLSQCQRQGSLDSNIVRSSEIVNDIPEFLKLYSTIKFLGFNGGAARTIYKRHVGVVGQSYASAQLPSTSPAHASITKKQKYQTWRAAMLPYLV